jgi:hypothetical protein
MRLAPSSCAHGKCAAAACADRPAVIPGQSPWQPVIAAVPTLFRGLPGHHTRPPTRPLTQLGQAEAGPWPRGSGPGYAIVGTVGYVACHKLLTGDTGVAGVRRNSPLVFFG